MREVLRGGVRALLALVACVLLAGVGHSPAGAHTDLVGTSPAAGSQVAAPVGVVSLEFSSVLVPEVSRIEVIDDAGNELTAGPTAVLGSRASATLASSAAGEYEVAYRVVSADGHPVVGSFRFVVARTSSTPGAARVAVTSPAAQPVSAVGAAGSRPTGGAGRVLPVVAGALVVLLVLGRVRHARRGAVR